MNKNIVVTILFLVPVFMLFSERTFAENRYHVAGFDDDKIVETFVSKFKEAVIKKDKETVASMILYPIKATFKDRAVIIHSEKEFLKLYDDVFDKELYNKIVKADTNNMWSNYQGVMIGDGDVWFSERGNDIKISAVGVCRQFESKYKK